MRRLGPEDVAVFRAIRLEALECEPAAFASSHDLWTGLPEEEWQRRLRTQAVFASFDGIEPVGLMGLLCEANPRLAHRGMMVMVYLRESHRGRGRAEALLAALEAEAQKSGLRQIELHAAAENTRALRFYQRMGFAAVGQLPAGYLHRGREIDEVLMVKRLAPR